MAEVSVIIPNCNGEKYLRECLDSLKEQTFEDFEIIVVDNGSQDGSVKIISEGYENVRLIGLDKNYGFSRAVNEGIKASEAPYVILLNNDTRADGDYIKALYVAISEDERIFSVNPRMIQMYRDGFIDSAGDMYCCLG